MKRVNWTTTRLADLDSHLTELDRELLHDVARFRLITGGQLTRLHLSELSPRSARRQLQRLVEAQVLARLDRQVGGVRAGSAGYVYLLGPGGARLLALTVGKRSWVPSQVFQRHTLGIAERYVQLVEQASDHRAQLLDFEPEPTCWRPFTTAVGAPQILKPDGYLALATEHHIDHWFLEVDFATHSLASIKRKARIYTDYLATGAEQTHLGVFPRVWWWTPRLDRAEALRRTLNDTDVPELHAVSAGEREVPLPLSGLSEG